MTKEQEQLTLKDVADAYLKPAPSEPTAFKHTTEATPSKYKPLKDFNVQKFNAANRGVGFELHFGEWLWYWLDSGKLDQRGTRPDDFCMARRGPDIGPYKRGNVDIKTVNANLNEITCTEERKEHLRKLYTGTTKCQATKDAMSVSAKARVARGDTPPDRSKPCYANGLLYRSKVEAGKALSVSPATILNRINAGKAGYRWA